MKSSAFLSSSHSAYFIIETVMNEIIFSDVSENLSHEQIAELTFDAILQNPPDFFGGSVLDVCAKHALSLIAERQMSPKRKPLVAEMRRRRNEPSPSYSIKSAATRSLWWKLSAAKIECGKIRGDADKLLRKHLKSGMSANDASRLAMEFAKRENQNTKGN